MSLSATRIKTLKPQDRPYKVFDGQGLYLLVNPTGSKLWRLKYRHYGKEKNLALGAYPEVSLADARDGREAARKLLRQDIDPGAERKKQKALAKRDHANTFKDIALEWHQKMMKNKSERHQQRALSILKNDLFPSIGSLPISKVTGPELLAAIRKIESRGALDIAHRARSTAGQVFRYGFSEGVCERDISRDLKGALEERPDVQHRAAITNPAELAPLLLAIDGYAGTPVVKVALQLSVLTFQRPGEIRHMEWQELDLDAAVWKIPKEKMKFRTSRKSEDQDDHWVPFSKQAVAAIRALQPITGDGKYVMPSQRGASRPMSNNAVRTALRTMGFDANTVSAHGFRATARTMLDEELGYRVDIIEHQLAHKVIDPNGRAYNRTSFLEARHKMMQGWADYLEELKSA